MMPDHLINLEEKKKKKRNRVNLSIWGGLIGLKDSWSAWKIFPGPRRPLLCLLSPLFWICFSFLGADYNPCPQHLLLKEERNRLSWLYPEKEGNPILHCQWALDYVPVSHGDKIPTAELASQLINTRSIPIFPIAKRNVIIPCVVNSLCNLYGVHWCRLQCITSWPFWLWIMAVTWLYFPFTLSRQGLGNLGMWAWAVHLYKVFTKVGQGPWLRGDSALGLPV